MTNVLSLEQTSPQPTSLSNLLEIHEINFEENWRYRTLSKLETLFHVTNVTTVLNTSVVSDRVSRWCLIFTGYCLQKSPVMSGSFAERDLQLKASMKYAQPIAFGVSFHSTPNVIG